MNDQLNTYFYPCALSLLFAISCIVSFKKHFGNKNARVFLALMFWTYFYSLFAGYANNSGLVKSFPHFFRTGHATTLLYMPFSYLYVSRIIYPRNFKWFDILHFLPCLFFLFDYAAFYAKPASEKMLIYEAAVGTRLISDLSEGSFTPKGFHVMLRYVLMASYCLAQCFMIRKAYKATAAPLTKNDAAMFNWLKWLTGSEIILITPALFNLFFSFDQVRVVNQFSGIMVSFVQGFFLFFKPEILYGFSRAYAGEVTATSLPAIPTAPAIPKFPDTKPSSLSEPEEEAWVSDMIAALEEYFQQTGAYMRLGINLHDLAKELNCSPNRLSHAINHHFGMNFNTLVNQRRIQVCCEKLNQFEFREKTLEAIAIESGFQSRSTFIKAFKTQTGFTPSDYVREIKAESVR